ncbi:hypothetical protein, partial [Klebsiella michiganensis]|uniref:hypothetical protein n=1 Tax=Klebsiella michiganensis TaxID=1134687 RepID=UPI001BAF78F2
QDPQQVARSGQVSLAQNGHVSFASINATTLNAFYVKYQLITSLINYGLMYLSCRDSNEQCPSTLPDRDALWSWRCCGAFYPVRVYRHSTVYYLIGSKPMH